MNVRAEPGVVRQVPAVVVGVIVDGDLITVPEPVAAEAEVVRRHAKIEPVEPETISPAAFKPELVSSFEPTREATVFPGVIEVVMRIVATRIMSDPSVVMVHVRNVRVAGHIGSMSLHSGPRRTSGRNVTATEGVTTTEFVAAAGAVAGASATTSALAKGGMRNHQ